MFLVDVFQTMETWLSSETLVNIVICRPVAREQVGKHVSMEMDSSKPARRCVINRRLFGYGNKRCFLSVRLDDI
jgi:hypothetical protein